jgi:cellulase/cellobiase CelA1
MTLLAAGALAGSLLLAPTSAAHAAVLFSDDFEQPTANVWTGVGPGSPWTTATEDGSKVLHNPRTDLVNMQAKGGWGSGTGTAVSVRVKPTSPLSADSTVSLFGRANINDYLVTLTGDRLELKQRWFSTMTVLASAPFTATPGSWYTLTLSFPTSTTVTASVAGPGETSASVSADDPGGTYFGEQFGVIARYTSASFDDIRVTNALPEPTPTEPPGPCPLSIAYNVGAQYPNSFSVNITIRNITEAPLNGWTMRWTFTNGQLISSLFNSVWYQVGPTVTARNPSWSAVLAPNATVTFGFQANGQGRAYPPTAFTVNGVPCQPTFT